MRVVENKELPTFAEGIRSGEGGLSKPHESGEHTLIKPEVVKPAAVPEISFSLFASPEAQKALKFINGEESEEEEKKNETDNSKDESNNENADDEDQGIMSRYRWRVVAKTVAACPRAQTVKPDASKKTTSPCRSVKTSEEVAPRMCRRASLAPDHRDQRCLSPVPPKGVRSRRMSLSPSRHPLLPSRPISPAQPANINKTSSESNLQVTNSSSSQELKSPPPKIDVTGGNPAIARALSRRRFSLPVTPSSQLLPPHPPSPLSPRRRFPVDRNSPSNSTDISSPTPIKNTGNQKTSVTSTLQANRQKLEALMKERSRAIANLTIGGSRESIPSPSSVKSKPDSPMMSPAPIRANHSLPRPILSRKSSITSETESDASQVETLETISLLDGDTARLDSMVADVIEMGSPPNSDVMSVKSESADSPRSLTASPLRLVGGRPVFQTRGSCSTDSGITLSDTASVGSEQEATPSTTNQTDEEIPRMSRLRNRRGTICMGSLSAFVAQTSGQSDARSLSSSPCPINNTNSNQRSKDDIEEEVEEELQKRIMQRKSQLLMQAAPGSFNMTSAVSRLEARANCKTTNGRLKKIMGSLTLERTTSELLSMKAAMNAAAKRREVDGIKKSKSLDCD